MGLLDFLKRPKYGYTPEEVQEKIKQSLVLREQKTPLEEAIEESEVNAAMEDKSVPWVGKPKKAVPNIPPHEKACFLVSNSFKLLPLFVINGRMQSGVLQKGMVAAYQGELICVKAIQEGLQKASRLYRGSRGSIEISTKIGLDIADGTLLEFVDKKNLKSKVSKRKKKRSRKKKINPKETEITLAVGKPTHLASISVPISSDKKI